MKIFYSVFTLIVIFFFMNVQAIVLESASLKDFLYGQTEACAYDNWISHISEGIVEEGYNVYAPYDRQTNGFGAFYIPTEDELDHWDIIAGFFASQSYGIVDVYFDVYDFPFEVVEFFDEDTQRTYYLIRELLNLDYIDDNGTDNTYDDEIGSFDYGWGLFIVNPEASYPVLITAPHPTDDYLTVAVALKCFQDWDAYGLFIAGAGREVAWTEEGTYSNSKSLSDPSRNEDHPFNIIYRKFCDLLRAQFNRREFSAQIHSYDWNAHIGYPDCQVSAGWGKYCPNLPIRDLSDLKIDLINASSHLMVPANTVGLHPDVYLNDFYGVNYSLYDFTFSDEDTTYIVNNNIDLPGYSQNQQMLYTFDGWNRYDVFEPFFHLEMDELPGCYQQSEANWKWFYSYNEDLQIYQMDQLFTKTLNFYQGWIDAMTEVLPIVFELNDQVDPPTPAEFRISESQFDTITLNWEPVSSFDFRTFEIIYADEPLSHLNYDLVDREVTSILASPLHNTKTIIGLEGSQNYFFKIRTQDYNGNYSEYSPEIITITSPADIANFISVGSDDQAELFWEAIDQIGNLGFKIYRREGTGNFELLASYLTHPELLGSSEPDLDYQFFDLTAQNDLDYTYQLASVNETGSEFVYAGQPSCSPRRIYSLIISNADATLADTVRFSANPYATNGFDPYYDLPDPGFEPPDYIQAAFYEANWQPGNRFLAQEIHYDFNPELDYRTWNLITSTDQENVLFNISVGEDYPRDGEKLYLREEESETMVDLTSQDYSYYSAAGDTVNFRLFWGNLLPVAYIVGTQNRILQAGDVYDINWNSYYPTLIEHLEIKLLAADDSLMIADNLINTASQYSWIVPDGIIFDNARIVIDVFTRHEEVLRFYSNYRLGIQPAITTFSKPAGWNTISSSWPDETWQVSVVFDPQAELYTFSQTYEYYPTDLLSFGNSYWLYSPEDIYFETECDIQQTQIDIPLQPGWNLIPNPHFCSYGFKDLRFLVNEDVYNCRAMLSEKKISRSIYLYRDHIYEKSDTIEPQESFLLYAYPEVDENFSCRFIPYNDSFELSDYFDWRLQVSAAVPEGDSDEMIAGVTVLAGDDYDFLYDQPEPPGKPIPESVSLYFRKDPVNDSLFTHLNLNQEFKSPLSGNLPEEKIWEFSIEVDNLSGIMLQADFSDFPDGFQASIFLDGTQFELQPDQFFTWQPSEPGCHDGELRIRNQHFSGIDHNTARISRLINYPNPFNPVTTLNFGLTQPCRVELVIYNIKGQKVKEVFAGNLTAGNHSCSWNGTDSQNRRVSSGIYFAKLLAGKDKQIRKLLVVK